MATLEEVMAQLEGSDALAEELSFDERVKAAIERSRQRVSGNPELLDVLLESNRSKADAFDFVVELLVVNRPNLFDDESENVTGGELVLAEIRRLVALDATRNQGDVTH